MKNQRGQITIEFLFSLALALGMFTLLFTMSFTLSMVEVAQYIVFSSARAMIASNLDPQTQEEAARQKYEILLKGKDSPVLSLFSGSWFSLSSSRELDVRTGAGKDFSADLAAGNDTRQVFTGVSTMFQSKILNFSIPFLGSTAEDDESAFSSRINAILIRESSQKECFDWYKARADALGTLPAGKAFYKKEEHLRMEDNGC